MNVNLYTEKNGFSLVETLVVMSIITIMSTVVLFSFRGLSEGGNINRAARDFALDIRRAQNMALAVAQVDVGSPAISQIPPAIGIYLVSGQASYIIFADTASSQNNKYDGVNEKIGNSATLPSNIIIGSIKDQSGTSMPSAHIIFTAPEASVSLSDATGNTIPVGEKIDIELDTTSGRLKKTITVRTNGQINIR